MAQVWSVIRDGVKTQISGGTLNWRVSATNIGAPPKRNLSNRGPLQYGATFTGFRYDTRVLSLVFFADAATLALADARRDEIYELWRGIENESITLEVVRDDGEVRVIDGEVVNVIDFPDAVGERFGASQIFAVQLECHDPFWRSQQRVIVPLTVNGTTLIPYSGQFFAEPLINIFGPITNPVLTQVATGKKLQFGLALTLGQSIQIDCRYGFKTVTDGQFANRIATLSFDSNLGDFAIDNFSNAPGQSWGAIAAAESNVWESVAYGNGVWVAVSLDGTNRVMRSTDAGVTWNAVAAAEANQWHGVAYGNGVWLAVAQSGTNRVMRSTNDGATWSAVAAAAANSWSSVAYGNGVWVAVSPDGANRVMRSTNNGVTWSAVTSAVAALGGWRSVAYGNGVWVAVASVSPNQIMRSTDDGVTWSAVAVPESNFWRSVAYGNNEWNAVALTGTNRVMRSTNNGVTWSGVPASEPNSWHSISYGNGIWIAVSYDGTNRVMRRTDDDTTWSSVAAVAANDWLSVAYGNGVWVAVASTGANRVMRSTGVSQEYTLIGSGTDSNTYATLAYNTRYLGI